MLPEMIPAACCFIVRSAFPICERKDADVIHALCEKTMHDQSLDSFVKLCY